MSTLGRHAIKERDDLRHQVRRLQEERDNLVKSLADAWEEIRRLHRETDARSELYRPIDIHNTKGPEHHGC